MDKSDKSIVNITLEKGYKLVQQKNIDSAPRYNRIGITKGDRMDLLDLMNELPKQEREVILYIKNNISYCTFDEEYIPLVNIKNMKVYMTKSQKIGLSRALKSLVDKGIIGKSKINVYMINPDLLIPQKYDKWKRYFDEL
jgi:hypothetical protein